MVALQIESQADESSMPTLNQGDIGKVIAILDEQSCIESYTQEDKPMQNTTLNFTNSHRQIHIFRKTSNKSEKMEGDKKYKKKKFKPADDLYCFEVDGIFTSTKVCHIERIPRPDLDFTDLEYFDYEPSIKLRCRNELDLKRSTKKNKLQKVHTQIRDEYFNRDKCIRLANDKSYHIKQRLVTRQNIRKECIEENIKSRKNNSDKRLKKMGVKLKGVCCPVETKLHSNIHPIRLKFDEEEQRRKEPRRIKKSKQKTEKKQKEPRKTTHFKTAPHAKPALEFPEYALHEGNISNAVDKQTKELIDLQYRDLTTADLDVLFKLDTEVIIKKSLDEQLNRDLAVVQKNIADAKELEDKIRRDSSRMLELMMQLQFRELSPEDYDLLLRLDETVKPKVATSNLVNSLKTLEVGPEKEGQCCLICMDDYVKGDMLTVLPCKHMYHTKCIEPWLTTSSNKCPLDSIEVL